MWLLQQCWRKLKISELRQELILLDLEPAAGFWVPTERTSIPILKAATNMPKSPSIAQMSYKELFVGSPFQVKRLLACSNLMHSLH